MGRVSDMLIERFENISFERGHDEHENPAFFWVNPWSGKREKVATLFWPTHPYKETEYVEELWDLLELKLAEPNADALKKDAELLFRFCNEEAENRAVGGESQYARDAIEASNAAARISRALTIPSPE